MANNGQHFGGANNRGGNNQRDPYNYYNFNGAGVNAYPGQFQPPVSSPNQYYSFGQYGAYSAAQPNHYSNAGDHAAYPNYYAAQTTFPVMSYPGWSNQQYGAQQYNNYQYPPGYDYSQQQSQQQYEQAAPQIRNPFAPPPQARTQFSAQNAQHDPAYEAQIAEWQSAYAPQDQYDKGNKRGGKTDKGENPNYTNLGPRTGPVQAGATEAGDAKVAKGGADGSKKQTVVRHGGGQTWEDETLLKWDPTHFRIQVGNLAGEVTDESLAKAFSQYGVSMARVIRDKRTTKSKGYGFVAFYDAELGFKAAREMLNKYIGSHPVTIQRAKADVRPVTKKDDKGKGKGNNKNNKNGGKAQDDPLRAHTGAHIEKKPVKNPAGYKLLG